MGTEGLEIVGNGWGLRVIGVVGALRDGALRSIWAELARRRAVQGLERIGAARGGMGGGGSGFILGLFDVVLLLTLAVHALFPFETLQKFEDHFAD